MEEIEMFEEVLDGDVNGTGSVNQFMDDIRNGRYMELLTTSKCQEVYCQYLDGNCDSVTLDVLLEKSVKIYMDHNCTTPRQQLEVLCMGIASLYAFVQSNWTGPPLENYQYPACDDCIVPWLQSWYKGSIMSEKQLQDEVTACLVLDGEICCPVMSHPELLLLARVCLQVCCDRPQPLLGSKWWLLRCLFVHQQVLDEFSPTLHKGITALLEELVKCEALMAKEHNHICFHLEAAQIHLFYRHVVKSQEHCKVALKAANMNLELTGALGKRTHFQMRELAQLTLRVSVDESSRPVHFPIAQSEHLPKDLRLNNEVRLDKIKFSNETDGEFPTLHPLEQAVVLGIFVQTLKSQPKDKLADEELMPYLMCLLSHPVLWSLQMSALLQRCRLEGHNSRTVERAMMQTEELVQCFTKRNPHAGLRHHYIFCSHLPPHWKVETELADLLVSLGVVKSALDIFLRLQLWEKVIMCYNLLNLRHKAAEIIQKELHKKETVTLWCLMGDATDDPLCYEKAWELSGHKSGRAQRHWALYYFNKKKYAESIPHLQESLAINSLQLSLWYFLGFAALVQENWSLCATAYQRYCALDPESFEAWNNLSKAYSKMDQKFRAWMALQESLKWNYENWHIWENYIFASTSIGKFHEVIQAYNRVLDLKEKHVDTLVLEILVDGVCSSEAQGDLKKKAEQLFTRLTQQVRNNVKLWQLFAKLTLTNIDNETYDELEKVVSYLHKAFWSAIQDSGFEKDIKDTLGTMQITSQLIDATLLCCSKCPRPEKTAQMLASAKLCLQTLIARIKRFYPSLLSREECQDEMAVRLKALETKLEELH
ncbi:tetratricopeptide repeat protein 27 isoform X2 [Zootermopsis nevadensis]|uniref:tetratricopeptide repeat protein 27 isoform X2 n=1 Tax=Zootermopsis nevadensis TaxID=136037 RepID=UPI000B8EAC89|nr:tetratricopeptide repeat protein 27 isoform X2 [Zootermopsis nevadensis]